MLSNIVETGSATIQVDNENSVVLVPIQSVQSGQIDVLNAIALSAIEQGFVSIQIDGQELVLVPYQGQVPQN